MASSQYQHYHAPHTQPGLSYGHSNANPAHGYQHAAHPAQAQHQYAPHYGSQSQYTPQHPAPSPQRSHSYNGQPYPPAPQHQGLQRQTSQGSLQQQQQQQQHHQQHYRSNSTGPVQHHHYAPPGGHPQVLQKQSSSGSLNQHHPQVLTRQSSFSSLQQQQQMQYAPPPPQQQPSPQPMYQRSPSQQSLHRQYSLPAGAPAYPHPQQHAPPVHRHSYSQPMQYPTSPAPPPQHQQQKYPPSSSLNGKQNNLGQIPSRPTSATGYQNQPSPQPGPQYSQQPPSRPTSAIGYQQQQHSHYTQHAPQPPPPPARSSSVGVLTQQYQQHQQPTQYPSRPPSAAGLSQNAVRQPAQLPQRSGSAADITRKLPTSSFSHLASDSNATHAARPPSQPLQAPTNKAPARPLSRSSTQPIFSPTSPSVQSTSTSTKSKFIPTSSFSSPNAPSAPLRSRPLSSYATLPSISTTTNQRSIAEDSPTTGRRPLPSPSEIAATRSRPQSMALPTRTASLVLQSPKPSSPTLVSVLDAALERNGAVSPLHTREASSESVKRPLPMPKEAASGSQPPSPVKAASTKPPTQPLRAAATLPELLPTIKGNPFPETSFIQTNDIPLKSGQKFVPLWKRGLADASKPLTKYEIPGGGFGASPSNSPFAPRSAGNKPNAITQSASLPNINIAPSRSRAAAPNANENVASRGSSSGTVSQNGALRHQEGPPKAVASSQAKLPLQQVRQNSLDYEQSPVLDDESDDDDQKFGIRDLPGRETHQPLPQPRNQPIRGAPQIKGGPRSRALPTRPALDDRPPPSGLLRNSVARNASPQRQHVSTPSAPSPQRANVDIPFINVTETGTSDNGVPSHTIPQITFDSAPPEIKVQAPQPAPLRISFNDHDIDPDYDEADRSEPVITISLPPSAPRITVGDTNHSHDHSHTHRQGQGADSSGVSRSNSTINTGLACHACGLAIVGRLVHAMNVRWHPHCFKCAVCSTLLEHVSSFEKDGRPYCHLDYHEHFAPRCFHCQTPIADERFITLDDAQLGIRTYHEQHFFCAECGDPFLPPSEDDPEDVGFTVYKGHPYCEACHVRLRLPKCSRCKKSIRDGAPAVEALGGKWCWECFTCSVCSQPFQDPAFFQRDNKPYCEGCYKLVLRSEI